MLKHLWTSREGPVIWNLTTGALERSYRKRFQASGLVFCWPTVVDLPKNKNPNEKESTHKKLLAKI